MSKTQPTWPEEVDKRLDALITLRRDFHRHPELSFQERRTSQIIAERLHAAGLEVRTGMAKTGVVGVLQGARPGPAMASADAFTVEVRGRGGHGAMPHLSVDPITTAANILLGMQNLVSREVPAQETAVLTIGQLVSGTKSNIIPDRAFMTGT